MNLTRLGEFGTIGLFRELIASCPASLQPLVGIGDDAAVWAATPGLLLLETTDLLIEEVHFSLRYFSWYDVGWKAMAVNVSDIAAMGGRPRAAFVSAGLRPSMGVADARELYRGLVACATDYDVAILGGDTVASPSATVINVALFGETLDTSGAILRRNRAMPGQVIAISGPLGASAAALQLLLPAQDGGPPRSPSSDPPASLRSAHVQPRPRVALGHALVRAGVRCAMDISDGLLADLGKICAASGVAARVDIERVPIAADVRRLLPEQALALALHGGEDYELLVCGASQDVERLGLCIIGDIVSGAGVRLVTPSGDEQAPELSGYDAFM